MTDRSAITEPSQMLNWSYAAWPPPRPPLPENLPNFGSTKVKRSNWKPKNSNEMRRNDPVDLGNIHKAPKLNEGHAQKRLKWRRFYPKKKFNYRFAPFAPRNTTSFIIRAKKSGGIASLVSPCPVTPAILPTPIFSPSREVLMDMAREEWGVDGYGSMNGLIRVRSPGFQAEEGEECVVGSSRSDTEERVEVERRLDHDLSRFEMVYPKGGGGDAERERRGTAELGNFFSENRFDDDYDEEKHIAQLEEENLTLKDQLLMMERELEHLRRRVQCLETDGRRLGSSSGGERRCNKDETSENEGGGGGGDEVSSKKSVVNGELMLSI